jgi:hypothetical protein
MFVVKVTQADIDNGVKRSQNSCPIALAIARKFPDKTVRVEGLHAYLRNGEHETYHSKKAMHFVHAFDGDSGNRAAVKPGYIVFWRGY